MMGRFPIRYDVDYTPTKYDHLQISLEGHYRAVIHRVVLQYSHPGLSNLGGEAEAGKAKVHQRWGTWVRSLLSTNLTPPLFFFFTSFKKCSESNKASSRDYVTAQYPFHKIQKQPKSILFRHLCVCEHCFSQGRGMTGITFRTVTAPEGEMGCERRREEHRLKLLHREVDNWVLLKNKWMHAWMMAINEPRWQYVRNP